MKKTFALILLLAFTEISFTAQNRGSRNLIVYFTEYANTGIDALSSASKVWQDKKYMGITEAMAKLVQKNLGGDLYSIQVEENYPADWDSLMEKSAQDRAAGLLHKLKEDSLDLSKYDKIYLAYPIWHRDLPGPVYSFLEKYDLSGKKVFLMTASNQGPAGTKNIIARLEQGAQIYGKVLDIRNTYVEKGSLMTRVRAWVKETSSNL